MQEEDVTHLKTGTIETILEMVVEGLESIRVNYSYGAYDQVAEDRRENPLPDP